MKEIKHFINYFPYRLFHTANVVREQVCRPDPNLFRFDKTMVMFYILLNYRNSNILHIKFDC